MQHISIVGKFLVIISVLGLFILGVVTYSATQIAKIDTNFRGLISGEMTAGQKLARANRAFQSARASIAELAIARSDSDNDKAIENLKKSQTVMAENFDLAASALPSQAGITVVKTEALKALTETCKPAIDLAAASISEADVRASQELFLSSCQTQFNLLSQKITELADLISDGADQNSTQLAALSRSTIYTTFTAAGIGLFLVLISSFFATKAWMVSPIRALAGVMSRLSEGDLQVDVVGTQRKDEIGGMAKAVQVFKDNGLRAQALASESEIMRSEAEATQLRTAEVDRIRAEAMAEATSGLGEGLRHLADGDLTFQLVDPFASDFESLRSDFNVAVGQLSATLQSVAEATGAIDNGSREVSASADDLSKRTEQQAASLEETAAALDQITVNVANSSKRADEARKIAVQANESAAQSGQVVANAVNAMQRIEQSSNQISNIIGVIDEIAFQTNLLALNAGVEAARAGDAGKGFAVVAQEVRELAQRSAQAAKEIKDLIRNSSEEVQSGVKLVSDTGEALKTIEAYIITVNQHMDSIATSAKEQSVGLAEVNTAVNQMDQVTQQNAAMVEETSAAGATLAKESGRLRELVLQFRLGGTPGQTAPVMAAGFGHRPVVSPVKRLAGQLRNAF